MTDWQSIETAPKDGTGFLYFQRIDRKLKWIGSAIWHNGHFAHVNWDDDEADWLIVQPTHWMPLPPAPEATQ